MPDQLLTIEASATPHDPAFWDLHPDVERVDVEPGPADHPTVGLRLVARAAPARDIEREAGRFQLGPPESPPDLELFGEGAAPIGFIDRIPALFHRRIAVHTAGDGWWSAGIWLTDPGLVRPAPSA